MTTQKTILILAGMGPRSTAPLIDHIITQRQIRYGATLDKTETPLARNRQFESSSLQRRARLSPESAFVGQEPRLSARVCAAGLASGSAETRRLFRYRSTRRQYLCRAIFQYRSAADGVSGNAPMVATKSEPSPGLIVR